MWLAMSAAVLELELGTTLWPAVLSADYCHLLQSSARYPNAICTCSYASWLHA